MNNERENEERRLINFLTLERLTFNQFYLAKLIYLGEHDLIRKYSKYIGLDKEDIEKLVNKMVIMDSHRKEDRLNDVIIPELYTPMSKIINFMKNQDTELNEIMFDQLFDVYPAYITINGKTVPARSIINKEALENKYAYLIKTNEELHNRILEVVQWAKETDNINLGITKFVEQKYWEALFEMRNKSSGGFGVDV